MYERFTDNALKVMELANQEAHRFNHEYIETEHILLGLVKPGWRPPVATAIRVLHYCHVDPYKLRLEVEKLVQSGPDDMVTTGRLPQTPRAKKVIEYSMEEARNLNHNYVGTEHILLGLLREQEGVAAQVLMNLGLTLEKVCEEVWLINLSLKLKEVREKARLARERDAEPTIEKEIVQGLESFADILEAEAMLEQRDNKIAELRVIIQFVCDKSNNTGNLPQGAYAYMWASDWKEFKKRAEAALKEKPVAKPPRKHKRLHRILRLLRPLLVEESLGTSSAKRYEEHIRYEIEQLQIKLYEAKAETP